MPRITKDDMFRSCNIDGLGDDFDDSDATLKSQIETMHERGIRIINPTMEIFTELARYNKTYLGKKL